MTSGRKFKILVMDDEEIIRIIIQEILDYLGYEAEIVSDGAGAVAQYKKSFEAGVPFAAVILDINIPGGMGGEETMKELLKIDPDVKGIVSSGSSDDSIMEDYSSYGFNGAVAKPYNIEELKNILENITGNK